ncbi:hypothetical protein ITJ57_19095 [Plantibacter sp. VKM Ac-2880]|uniref:hypothetical protein n=1 Tax=Plantibacter sp. VKM Ac-2880 TaxID=2783827 RepID=UPI00188EFE6B|nr:hypothetical protein [Plantibacter sp. VKM Ac-2880]MBF4570879.1 hypothetical protein [Plantibacter sp. VKM Ac-2880]
MLRHLIADGALSRSALPEWADMTEVNGTPLIIDFTEQPDESTTVLVGRLLASEGLQQVELDDNERRNCIDTTTDEDIELSQGGKGYLQSPAE